MYVVLFSPTKTEQFLAALYWLRTQDLLSMKYDKCIRDKDGSIGKGQHARGQYGVLIDGCGEVVHPTIENYGPRGNEEHTAGDSEEYIDALIQFGLQQMPCKIKSRLSC